MDVLKKRKILLSLDSWTIADLMSYEGIGRSKAYQIKNEAVRLGCGVRFNPKKINVSKYLALKGIDRANEIKMLNLAMNESREVKEDEINAKTT